MAPPDDQHTCEYCNRRTRLGRAGEPDSEFAGQWFCNRCWRAWEKEAADEAASHEAASREAASAGAPGALELDAPCLRPSCGYLRHSIQDHGFCCNCCAAGEDHGPACERRQVAVASLRRADGRCAREGCAFWRHSSEEHAYCCRSCGCGDAHGKDCEKRPHGCGLLEGLAVLQRPVPLDLKCVREECMFARHSAQGHRFCCLCCANDMAHGAECERRPFVALEMLGVGTLRQLCQSWGADAGACLRKASSLRPAADGACGRGLTLLEEAHPRPHRPASGAANREVPPAKGEAVLGWAAHASYWNPLDAREYAAPLMSPEEFEAVSLPLEEVEDRLLETMQKHGCAVVTGVANTKELHSLEDLFMSDLEALLDEEALKKAPQNVKDAREHFRARGPRAFPRATASRLTESAGFVLRSCLMQGRFAWQVRRSPGVHRCFRALYPHDEGPLVTSMDVTFFTPEGDPPSKTNRFSAHVDQNAHDVREGLSDCPVYQGALYVWPADEASSTTALWPGSHLEPYAALMEDPNFEKSGKRGLHYCEISHMQDRERAKELAEGWAANARRVPVPAGALLLWSSRTAHAGWKGGPRLAQAVCLEPASRRSEAQRVAKLRLAALGLPSTHWAQIAMQHDMVLGDPGFFGRKKVRARGSPAADAAQAAATGPAAAVAEGLIHDQAVLPLLPAARPSPLAEGADLKALALLTKVKYFHTGMWTPPTEGSVELLERSVREECKVLV